ncbi:MAG TPA: hypothetical protein VGO40_24835 [Longimicrobium sp.]|jgi:hypothetical protein|nr:hypothetical protein [Longimicrobium sp.]
MHLLNVTRLADELREDALSEKDKLGYLLAIVVIAGLVGGASGPAFRTPIWAATALLQLVISLGGIWYCFAANERGDGRSFIERYVCLGFPLGIWWIGAYYGFYFLGLAAASVPAVSRAQLWYRSYPALAMVCLSPLYYVALARYVARAAGVNAPPARS